MSGGVETEQCRTTISCGIRYVMHESFSMVQVTRVLIRFSYRSWMVFCCHVSAMVIDVVLTANRAIARNCLNMKGTSTGNQTHLYRNWLKKRDSKTSSL